MHREGGCACGAIRFETDAEPLIVSACHCTDCQKFSGGGPNYAAALPSEAIMVMRGTPDLYEKTADSGQKMVRAYCAQCGTHLWNVVPNPPLHLVKVGAFDQSADLAPQMHIFTASAPPWHSIPEDVPTFPRMPPR